MKKLLIFFISAIFIVACSKNETAKDEIKSPKKPAKEITGETIYNKYCKLCHGAKGNLGVSGSADLTISVLTKEEKISVITNGRKTMTSFKDQLTPEQIIMVAAYIETLHQ
ncbi:MAG: cytochrome c [Chitinophagales bacterium]|nr:cytochrome c [Chitinophagales bacterium]